mmetsp:Transcript_15194/g.30792  ORF Transcript_15194/g.30792 Transcript_15194/m.30792 type:complete len:178 (-) Transcript_15194:1345-1878(-)
MNEKGRRVGWRKAENIAEQWMPSFCPNTIFLLPQLDPPAGSGQNWFQEKPCRNPLLGRELILTDQLKPASFWSLLRCKDSFFGVSFLMICTSDLIDRSSVGIEEKKRTDEKRLKAGRHPSASRPRSRRYLMRTKNEQRKKGRADCLKTGGGILSKITGLLFFSADRPTDHAHACRSG